MKPLTLFLLTLTFASQGWGQVQMDRINVKGIDGRYELGGYAKCDGVTDDTAAIQGVLDAAHAAGGGEVIVPPKVCATIAPLKLYDNIWLHGSGRNISFIKKITNTIGTTGNIAAPNRTLVNDNYNIDAIVEVVHATNAYTYHWKISDLYLQCSAGSQCGYAIYAPRAAQYVVEDIYTSNTTNGFYANDNWLATIRHATFDTGSYGVKWADDGSGNGTGTSLTLDNVWSVNMTTKCFDIFGLSYSSFQSLACDHYNVLNTDLPNLNASNAAYSFNSSVGISLNGAGLEDSHGQALYAAASTLSITAFRAIAAAGNTSAGSAPAYTFFDGSQVEIRDSNFATLSPAGNYFNEVIQDGSSIVFVNSVEPSGGNTFIGYGGGSSKIVVSKSGMVITGSGIVTGVGLTASGTSLITLGQTVVGSLPSAASNPGAMILVTDSTAVASEGQTCVGSSTNKALAVSTGSQWKCF